VSTGGCRKAPDRPATSAINYRGQRSMCDRSNLAMQSSPSQSCRLVSSLHEHVDTTLIDETSLRRGHCAALCVVDLASVPDVAIAVRARCSRALPPTTVPDIQVGGLAFCADGPETRCPSTWRGAILEMHARARRHVKPSTAEGHGSAETRVRSSTPLLLMRVIHGRTFSIDVCGGIAGRVVHRSPVRNEPPTELVRLPPRPTSPAVSSTPV